MLRFFKSKVFLFALASATMVGFYHPTLWFDFINYDDPFYILDNPSIHYFKFWSIFAEPSVGLYHPLTTASFALDWWLGQGQPWAFHFSNLLCHFLAGAFLYLCCEHLWPKRPFLIFFILMTFWLHPLKVESVAWVSIRKDLLSGLFVFASFYSYMVFAETKKKSHGVICFFLFLLGMLSKASILFLPLVFLTYDYLKNNKITFKDSAVKVVAILAAFPITAYNAWEQTRLRSDLILPERDPWQLFYQLQFYFEKTVLPLNLRLVYEIQSLKFSWTGGISFLFFAALTYAVLKFHNSHRKAFILGFSFFSFLLIPFLKLIPFGDENLVNDRYMYLPLTGLTWMYFPTVFDFFKSKSQFVKSFALLLFAGVFSLWMIILPSQIRLWENSLKMWSVFYDREPSSKKIASIYSKALMLYQDYPKAIEVLKKGEGSAEDIGNLGYALLKLNQPTEAMSSIERGLSYYPEHPFLLYVKAMILHSQGKFSQSEQSAKAGLDQLHKELSPKLRSQLLNQWGLALLSLEKNSEAEAAFNEATLLHRKDLILFYNLGLSQLNQRKYDLAEQNFLLALSLDGRHPQSLNSMGVIYFNRKLYPQALAYFKKSLEVAPDFLLAAENLKKTEKILELTKSQ